jgi:hypothetical protein
MHDSLVALTVTAISSIFLIVLIGLILFLFLQKSPGFALCLIGVFMAIAAAVQGSVTGISINPNSGQMLSAAGSGSGPLAKVAVILVLGGTGMIFLSRGGSAPAPSIPKETTHVA